MNSVILFLAGDPVGFARARSNGAQRFTPKLQRNTAAAFRVLAQQEMAGRELLDGPLEIGVVATFAIPKGKRRGKHKIEPGELVTKRPDYDNLAKLPSDACCGVVYRDDAQIALATIRKQYGEKPSMMITIRPAETVVA